MKNVKYYLASVLLAVSLTVSATPNSRVASGFYHSLYLDSENNVLAIGQSQYGSLGQYADAQSVTLNGMSPVHVGIKAKTITAGYSRSAAIRQADGSILTWGFEKFGTANFVPKAIPGNYTNVKDIALTLYDLYFVSGAGALYKYSFDGAAPTQLSVSNVVEISAGLNHLIILDAAGSVYTLGQNNVGQLGLGDTTNRDQPTLLTGVSALSVGAGQEHSLVVLTDGTVVAFGNNGTEGRLGAGSVEPFSTTPLAVQNLYDVKMVNGGSRSSIAVTNTGSTFVWGWHNYIGNGGYNSDPLPLMVTELAEVNSVSSYSDTILTMDIYGAARGWGSNAHGRLGDGTNIERHAPTNMLPATRVDIAEVLTLMPQVASVDPGGSYIITGQNFGDDIGTVTVAGVDMVIISWTATVIHIDNPIDPLSGNLVVTTLDGRISDPVLVSLEPTAPVDVIIEPVIVVPAPPVVKDDDEDDDDDDRDENKNEDDDDDDDRDENKNDDDDDDRNDNRNNRRVFGDYKFNHNRKKGNKKDKKCNRAGKICKKKGNKKDKKDKKHKNHKKDKGHGKSKKGFYKWKWDKD